MSGHKEHLHFYIIFGNIVVPKSYTYVFFTDSGFGHNIYILCKGGFVCSPLDRSRGKSCDAVGIDQRAVHCIVALVCWFFFFFFCLFVCLLRLQPWRCSEWGDVNWFLLSKYKWFLLSAQREPSQYLMFGFLMQR